MSAPVAQESLIEVPLESESIIGLESSGDFEAILAEIKERDERDSTRKIAPLKPADDALIVDTTGLSIEEVVEKLAKFCRQAQ